MALFWSEALCLFKSSGSPLCFGETPFRGLTKLRQTGGSVLRNTEKACKHCKAPESWAILGGECRVKPQEALTAQHSVACSRKAALVAEGWRGLTREGARGGAVLGAGLGQIGRWDRKLRSGDQCGDQKGGKTGELQVWGGVGRGLRGGLGAYILVFRIHTSCRYLSGSVYMRKVYFYIPQTAYMLKNNNNNNKKPSVWKKPGVIPRGWEVRIARGRLAKPRCGASWRLWSWRQASLAHLSLSLCAASEGRFHNAFCIEVSFCLVAQLVKNPPAVQVSQVWSLGWEDNLEKEMATHSSVLAWRIPWAEKPGGLQSVGSQESDMTLRLNRHLVLPKRYTENVLKKVVT